MPIRGAKITNLEIDGVPYPLANASFAINQQSPEAGMYQKFFALARTMLWGDIATGTSKSSPVDLYLRVIGGRRALVMRDPQNMERFFSGIEVPPQVEALSLRVQFPAVYPDEFMFPTLVPPWEVRHHPPTAKSRFGWEVNEGEKIPATIRELIGAERWCRIYITASDGSSFPASPEEHLEVLELYGKNLFRAFGAGPHVHELDMIVGCGMSIEDLRDMPEPDWDFV